MINFLLPKFQFIRLQDELEIPNTKKKTIGLKRIRKRSKQYANIDSFLTDINRFEESYLPFAKSKTFFALSIKGYLFHFFNLSIISQNGIQQYMKKPRISIKFAKKKLLPLESVQIATSQG